MAAAMLALILIPASTWKSPKVDATVNSFDPNLMYSDSTGTGTVAGQINFPRSRSV